MLSVLNVLCAQAQQASQTLTLQDCIRLAESAPSAVSIARQERESAAREASRARAGYLPQSYLANGFTYNSPLVYDRTTFSFAPLNGIREYALLFNVSQEFDTSGRLRAEMSKAHVSEELASADIALSRRDLKRAVTASYYRTLLTRRIVHILQGGLSESQLFEKRARQMFAGGEVAQADVIKASAQVAFLEQALNTAQLNENLANQELASFWTSDVAQPLALVDVLDDSLPVPGEEPSQSTVFLKRPEFDLLDAQQRGFQADVRLARADLLPQLGAVFQYGIDSTAVRIKDRGYAAFVNLTIPIFDWNKARSAMQQARIKERQVEQTREISKRIFSKEYQSALARAKQLFVQISLTYRQTTLSEEDLQMSRIRYEGGEGLALDVVTAQNQLSQARTNYYAAIVDYLNAKADLEVASGQ
jgi:outer membrane protein